MPYPQLLLLLPDLPRMGNVWISARVTARELNVLKDAASRNVQMGANVRIASARTANARIASVRIASVRIAKKDARISAKTVKNINSAGISVNKGKETLK